MQNFYFFQGNIYFYLNIPINCDETLQLVSINAYGKEFDVNLHFFGAFSLATLIILSYSKVHFEKYIHIIIDSNLIILHYVILQT